LPVPRRYSRKAALYARPSLKRNVLLSQENPPGASPGLAAGGANPLKIGTLLDAALSENDQQSRDEHQND
jgi:hypothetical protein